MAKIINVTSCRECPYLRYPWVTIKKYWACENFRDPENRSHGEEYWSGGDALPGDKKIENIDVIQPWCKLNDKH